MNLAKARCPNCERQMAISQVDCQECGIRLEAEFDLSPLARLSEDDQRFVVAFVISHGSLKRMGALLKVSYPTIKNRLQRLSAQLSSADSNEITDQVDVLVRVARHELSVDEALRALGQ